METSAVASENAPRRSWPQATRAPWRRGAWTRTEVAEALHAQRETLSCRLRARGDARGLSDGVLEEITNDAIGIVVMMRRPITSEEHLIGAFWTTARVLIRQHREGRHQIKVGRRARVGLEDAAAWVAVDERGPDETLLLKDRLRRAADFIAQLDNRERQVVATMATRAAGARRPRAHSVCR
jgi:hypothetical protein